jgi:hypothetical protein
MVEEYKDNQRKRIISKINRIKKIEIMGKINDTCIRINYLHKH